MLHHRDLHPEWVDDCYPCKLATLNLTASPEVKRIERKERVLRSDLDSYKRLRDDGLQPKQIDGSHELESKVNSQWDIDLGRIIPKNEESRVREGFDWARHEGLMA